MHDLVVAQLTDIHIGPETDPICAGNMERLKACINRIMQMKRKPDLLLLTGDLTEYGDDESLGLVLDNTRKLGIPIRVALGNHDVMGKSAAALRQKWRLPIDWFSQTESSHSLRVVVADTGMTGLHGGAFSDKDVETLLEQLANHPDVPTLLAVHHPPCRIGIDWMDPKSHEPWLSRLENTIQSSPQLIGIVCGHVHVSAHTVVSGIRVSVSPAVAPQSRVELALIEPDNPDGRILIERSPPGFSLHHFVHGNWTTLPVYVDNAAPVFRFERKNAGAMHLS